MRRVDLFLYGVYTVISQYVIYALLFYSTKYVFYRNEADWYGVCFDTLQRM